MLVEWALGYYENNMKFTPVPHKDISAFVFVVCLGKGQGAAPSEDHHWARLSVLCQHTLIGHGRESYLKYLVLAGPDQGVRVHGLTASTGCQGACVAIGLISAVAYVDKWRRSCTLLYSTCIATVHLMASSQTIRYVPEPPQCHCQTCVY